MIFDFVIKFYFDILTFLSNSAKFLYVDEFSAIIAVLAYIVTISAIEFFLRKFNVRSSLKAGLFE